MEGNEKLADFGSVEYVVFASVLALSASIGIYFGCFGSRQKTTEEFLMANRQMSFVPVALSLICSFVSAITILGNPAEIYLYGTQYGMVIFSFVLLTLSLSYLYVPVFYNLKVSSAYEYLELRFGKGTRRIVSLFAIFHLTIYMAIVVLGPSLALEQVTGINLRLSTAAIFLVCIFYSSIGGLKAVLWTDALQAMIMIGSLIVVVVKGISDVGGISIVWERAEKSGHIQFFNFDADPRTRHTFWTAIFGGYFMWIPMYAATQAQVQRYLSVPTLKSCRRALWMNMVGLMGVITLCFLSGLVLFAKYYDCDPLKNKDVQNSDQLLPFFVMDTSGTIPGLPGLFVAGLTCASLSSVSSGLSALSSIITYDYIKKILPGLPDEKLSFLSKIMCVLFGALSFGCVFIVENMGNILPAASSLVGMIVGPTLGVFTLGMFFPWSHSKASVWALLISMATMMTFGVGVFIANNDKLLPDQRLPLSTEGCGNHTTASTTLSNFLRASADWKTNDDSALIQILSISYIWFPCIGCVLTVFLGLVFSVTCPHRDQYHKRSLFSPPVLSLWEALLPKATARVLDPLEGLVSVELTKVTESIKIDNSSPSGIDNLGSSLHSINAKETEP